ncbi:facilitated trehalose transporter Tret1-like [Oratosquilla oratoria]|uniref:facilitated trehalose transporter Tret1-like n=1 Tax=Oratosquilla oratoria TaxID=337810 RepID=UPI003F7720CB
MGNMWCDMGRSISLEWVQRSVICRCDARTVGILSAMAFSFTTNIISFYNRAKLKTFIEFQSPYWLLRRGREEDARLALETLRGRGTDVENELENCKTGLEQQTSYTIRDEFVQLISPNNYKPVLLMVAVQVLSNMCGHRTIILYAYLVAPGIGVIDQDPMTGTITLAIAGLLSSVISSSLLDRSGRRPLLIGSALLSAASLLAASVLMIFPVLPGWVALLSVHVFVFGAGLGLGTVPGVLTGEIIPTAVRYVGVTICMITGSLGLSLSTCVFPEMVSNIGLSYTFMVCAFFSIFMAVFTWKWVPETKGKHLVELQKEFTDARDHQRT